MKLRLINPSKEKQDPLFASMEVLQLLESYSGYYAKIGFAPPWAAYLIIVDDKPVGTCSFGGEPKDGQVEISYWTFRDFEGQGIASLACEALVSIANEEMPGITVVAKTEPEHNASTRILQKNGFIHSKVVQDDDIGDAWLWVLKNQESVKT